MFTFIERIYFQVVFGCALICAWILPLLFGMSIINDFMEWPFTDRCQTLYNPGVVTVIVVLAYILPYALLMPFTALLFGSIPCKKNTHAQLDSTNSQSNNNVTSNQPYYEIVCACTSAMIYFLFSLPMAVNLLMYAHNQEPVIPFSVWLLGLYLQLTIPGAICCVLITLNPEIKHNIFCYGQKSSAEIQLIPKK